MDVTLWYSAEARMSVNAIFLRMPLSDSNAPKMGTYATNLMEAAARYANGYAKFELQICGEKQRSYTDYVITDKAAAMAALDSIKRKGAEIHPPAA